MEFHLIKCALSSKEKRKLNKEMIQSAFLLLASFLTIATSFEGQIQRMLYYAAVDRVLERSPVSNLQPLLDSRNTIILPLVENKVVVREIDPNHMEPIYVNGGQDIFKVGDNNRYIYLGEQDGLTYVAAEFSSMEDLHCHLPKVGEDTAEATTIRSLREVSEKINDDEALSLLAQAVAYNTWHTRTNKCCRCGSSLLSERGGAVLRCTDNACGASSYPRIEPATMNFITDENNKYVLLGRKASWPEGRYSCLAGFLEIGETLEQCVMRETMEESGVQVYEDSIVYAGSQPWPFPSSLMVGFRGVAAAATAQERGDNDDNDYDDDDISSPVEREMKINDIGGGIREITLGVGGSPASINADGAVVLPDQAFPGVKVGAAAVAKGKAEVPKRESRERERERERLPPIRFDATEMDDVSWFSRDEVRVALKRSQGSTSLGADAVGFTEKEAEMHGSLHFPGPSSMARVMLSMWAEEAS